MHMLACVHSVRPWRNLRLAWLRKEPDLSFFMVVWDWTSFISAEQFVPPNILPWPFVRRLPTKTPTTRLEDFTKMQGLQLYSQAPEKPGHQHTHRSIVGTVCVRSRLFVWTEWFPFFHGNILGHSPSHQNGRSRMMPKLTKPIAALMHSCNPILTGPISRDTLTKEDLDMLPSSLQLFTEQLFLTEPGLQWKHREV